MNLFTEHIDNWRDWGNVFQSIPAFTPLVGHILQKENLPLAKIENLTPGTNAVFKARSYVVKIFAPAESGMDQTLDLQTELFAIRWALNTGVSTPRMVAHGFVQDKYLFAYIITEYIEGTELAEAVERMTEAEKNEFGCKLRAITDRMNAPCEPFNGIDVINDEGRYIRWDKGYSDHFKAERLAYIHAHNYGEKVFVHGDLCADNILLTPDGGVYIIDFADAVLAPRIYEHSLVAVELFDLDPALLRGYFGSYTADELTDICVDGLLIHDFGGDIIAYRIGKPDELQGLDDLRKKLRERINKK